jgi:molybdate transport system ATP-binding protein
VGDRRLSVTLRQPGPIPLDVDFTCDAGEVLAIFGPSGSGKTTILRSIAGLYHAASASIRAGSASWTDTATQTFTPPHRRKVGFVFQDYALFPHLSAEHNVAMALGHHPAGRRRARAAELLALVHLSERRDRRPHQLSGGERQRVALARALARDPSVLLLDEPFAAVDRPVRRSLQDEIDGLRRTLDFPVVLVTHDFGDVVRLATHLVLLDRGRAVAQGGLSDLMSRADLSWIREAIGLGSVFEARVARRDAASGLTELTFDGGALFAADRALEVGATVRVRIAAREVILAAMAPDGLSVHNVLAGTVSATHRDSAFERVVVQLAVGGLLLLAEVTPDAIDRLDITIGRRIYALIKSVSIDCVGGGASASTVVR